MRECFLLAFHLVLSLELLVSVLFILNARSFGKVVDLTQMQSIQRKYRTTLATKMVPQSRNISGAYIAYAKSERITLHVSTCNRNLGVIVNRCILKSDHLSIVPELHVHMHCP